MLLKVYNLEKKYSSNTGKDMQSVVSGLSFSLNEGECIGIIGRSGCGKTTLLKLVSGILSPDSGSIEIINNESRIVSYPVAFVFQEPYLLPWRTIRENIRLACQISYYDGDIKKFIDNLLIKVGLKEAEWKYPHEVSGGMQSRCALARALAVRSQFLFMDEPFGSLDPATRYDLQGLVRKVIDEEKRCAILVTHSIEEAFVLCNKIFVFRNFCGGIKEKDFLEINNPFSGNFPNPDTIWIEPKFLEVRRNILTFLGNLGRLCATDEGG